MKNQKAIHILLFLGLISSVASVQAQETPNPKAADPQVAEENLKVEFDEIFPEIQNKDDEINSQFVMGSASILLQRLLFKNSNLEDLKFKRLNQLSESAEKALLEARNLMTPTELDAKIEVLRKSETNYLELARTQPNSFDELLMNTQDEIQRLNATVTVTPELKQKQIETAEKTLSEVRAQQLLHVKTAHKSTLLGKTIKGVKVLGSSVIIVDLSARVYIWTALNKNPTWSPVGSYLYQKGAPEFLAWVQTWNPSSAKN